MAFSETNQSSRRVSWRRSRGAASVEAVIALPVLVLLFISALYVRDQALTKQQTEMRARTCAWLYSAANCDESLIPSDCRDVVKESTGGESAAPNWNGALGDGARSLLSGQGSDGIIASVVAELVGPALRDAFTRSLDATATKSIERPAMFGGDAQVISGRYHLACNLKPTTLGEVASDAWKRFRP